MRGLITNVLEMNLTINLFFLFMTFLSVQSAMINVTCYPDHMKVIFDKNSLKGSTAYLDDSTCEKEYTVVTTNTSVILEVPLFDCGTTTELAENYIAFYNKIKVRVDNPGPIIRTDDVYPVGCVIGPTFGTVSRNKSPFQEAESLVLYTYGNGSYTFKLDIYKSERFAELHQFPLSLKAKQRVYFELSVNQTSDNVSLAVEECVATPTTNLNEGLRYTMIKQSCLMDPTLLEYSRPELRVRRYSFEAFRFKNKAPMVYLHCKLRVCINPNLSTCEERCKTTGARRRRSSDTSAIITYGPFFISPDKKEEDSPLHHDEQPLFITVIGIFAAAAFLSCGIIIGVVVYKKKQQQQYSQAEKDEMV